MQACRARYLSVIVKDSGKQVQLSVKEVDKERGAKTSIASEVMISKPAELQTGHIKGGNGENIISEGRGGSSTKKPKTSRVSHRIKLKKKRRKVTAVSASWHVSHNKQKGNPGFDLDYAPPQEHPPSHN
ncbi:hypothetical protein NE237_013482 [Protea cynaroides]|uniref:Uncharacterized protein n=1 Tax=Protea cynaroides TaxID=273540 RepID=A0A9Q0H014_9MAGN|nr:hypothetical protein NE237_013482 [Protea cynaroides]